MIQNQRTFFSLPMIILFAVALLGLSRPSAFAKGDPPEPARSVPAGQETVFVKEFKFTGNTKIDTATLENLTKEYTNRELTLDDMKAAADQVTIAYQEKGYILAKAIVPKQEIRDGILNITIQEGAVGKVTVSGNTYYSDRVIKRYFIPQIQEGVIKEETIEQAVLLTNDIPKNETRVVLKKGEQPGTSDINLNTKDAIGARFGVDYNNFGSKLISRDRFGSFLEFTEPWWGSTLELRGVTGDTPSDSTLGSFLYKLPVSNYGTHVDFKYLTANYVVGQQFADLGLKGDTEIYGASIVQPMMRSRNMNLYATLDYEHKFQKNFILQDITRSIDKVDVFHLTFDFDNLDRFLGKNFVSLSFGVGKLHMDDENPPSRLGAEDQFAKVNLSVARIQRIYESVNLLLRFYGQISDGRLVPFEQFVIGGYGTVRGHEPALFIGDNGYTFTSELMFAPPLVGQASLFGQRIAQMVQFALFYDYGYTDLNKPAIGESQSENLAGYGAGLRLFYKDRFTFKFDVAWPTDRQPDEHNTYYYFMGTFRFF